MDEYMLDQELIKALRVEIVSASLSTGVDLSAALDVAARVEVRLAQHLADEPRGLAKAERNARVRAEWDGRNGKDLMRRYRISRASLYRIVSRKSS